MHVHLIRHAQSTFNVIFDETGRDPQIRDASLSELGRQQAIELGKSVMAVTQPDTVLTSPLTRAVWTASLTFPRARIEVCPLCREALFSSCDVGRPPHLLAADFPHLDWSELGPKWWLDGGQREVDRTTEDALGRRVLAFLRFLEQRQDLTLAVVSHGAFLHRMTGVDFTNCELRTYSIGELREVVLQRYGPEFFEAKA